MKFIKQILLLSNAFIFWYEKHIVLKIFVVGRILVKLIQKFVNVKLAFDIHITELLLNTKEARVTRPKNSDLKILDFAPHILIWQDINHLHMDMLDVSSKFLPL